MAVREKTTNLWLERFKREAQMKSGIILEGNTMDLVFMEGVYRPVNETVIECLRKQGFDNIIHWDPADGIDQSMDSQIPQCNTSSAPAQASAYNLGGGVHLPAASGHAYTHLKVRKTFFSMVEESMQDDQHRTAIIVDAADYVFGTSRGNTSDELDCLASIEKAIRESHNYEVGGMRKNLLVFILKDDASIPPSVYQGQPLISRINIPLPSRDERKRYVCSNLAAFHLSEDISVNKVKQDDFIDALEGRTLLDIAQIMKLSQTHDKALSGSKLINFYLYGEKSSPWEDLSCEKIKTIREKLRERVKGQDAAIEKVRRVVINANTGLSGLQHSASKRKPKGVLFFVGPTGVGKTELAKALAEFVFGDEQACLRYDMSEYSMENSDQRLIGAPPGYVGYEKGGELTNAVKAKPFSVLLFDEVEKAHPRVLDKFLQILEDGRLTDGKGETVNFSETIIIFTSNIGAAEATKLKESSTEAVRQIFEQAVRNRFVQEMERPELLNRLGNNIVVFDFIRDCDVYRQILLTKLRPCIEQIKERYHADLVLDNADEVADAILSHLNVQNGGRGILNEMEERLILPLSEFIFERKDMLEGRRIRIEITGEMLLPTLE